MPACSENDRLLVYITLPCGSDALEFGRMLVAKRLAAGVNILSGLTSIYTWQNCICQRQETLLLAQTTVSAWKKLEEVVRKAHPDQVPCIIAMKMAAGFPPFLEWIGQNTVGKINAGGPDLS